MLPWLWWWKWVSWVRWLPLAFRVPSAYHAKFSRVTAHRLTISYVPGLTISDEPSCNRTGTYRWKFTNIKGASNHLKLKKIHDACQARVHLFTGTWLTASTAGAP